MKQLLAMWLVACLMLLNPIGVYAQSGGNCSTFRSWNTGDSLTAGDLNSSFTTVGVTNLVLSCVDSYSDSVANMQSATNPYASDSESLATSAQGELERLRYILQDVFGWANWYRRDTSIDFAQGTGIDGVGQGRHVTAVGFHSWSGSLRWPAITSVAAHTSGIFWPAAHHLTISFDSTSNSGMFGSGQTNARSWYNFHADALTLHHTAALRVAHSLSQMGNGQYGHITVLRVTSGSTQEPNRFGFQKGNDQLVFGHARTTMRIEGTGLTGAGIVAIASDGRLSTTAAGSVVLQLSPLNAVFGTEKFPQLARHLGANMTSYALMFNDYQEQVAHFYAVLPTGLSFSTATVEIFSRQGTRTSGTVGWHIGLLTRADGEAFDAAHAATSIVYPASVKGTAGQVLRQTEDLNTSGWAAGEILRITIQRMNSGTDTAAATENTSFLGAVVNIR